jgi:hypothetical protein
MRNLRATWWSLNDAIFWIASSSRRPLLQSAFWECPRSDFDSYAFFSAAAELEAALLDDELAAHASIDTAPVALVSSPYWSSVSLIPSWGDLSSPWTEIWPDFLILSQKPFRAEALLDHTEPANAVIPDAGNPDGELAYYRVTTDVMFRRHDVLRLWPADDLEELALATTPKKRKKRKLTIKVEQTLPMMTHNGLSLAEEKRGLSNMKIAELLANRWADEGYSEVPEFDAIAKSVERYYKRHILSSEGRRRTAATA